MFQKGVYTRLIFRIIMSIHLFGIPYISQPRIHKPLLPEWLFLTESEVSTPLKDIKPLEYVLWLLTQIYTEFILIFFSDITPPSTSRSSKSLKSNTCSNQNFICTSFFSWISNTRYLHWFDFLNKELYLYLYLFQLIWNTVDKCLWHSGSLPSEMYDGVLDILPYVSLYK
jgi:hypothetical protein